MSPQSTVPVEPLSAETLANGIRAAVQLRLLAGAVDARYTHVR